MKLPFLHPLLSVFALAAFAALTVPVMAHEGHDHDEERERLVRMSGTYRQNNLTFAVATPGNLNFTIGAIGLRLPKGEGGVRGSLIANGTAGIISGRVTRAEVRGSSVYYTGRVNMLISGVSLSQRFRMKAVPSGPNGEVLVYRMNLSGPFPGGTATISGRVRATK